MSDLKTSICSAPLTMPQLFQKQNNAVLGNEPASAWLQE